MSHVINRGENDRCLDVNVSAAEIMAYPHASNDTAELAIAAGEHRRLSRKCLFQKFGNADS